MDRLERIAGTDRMDLPCTGGPPWPPRHETGALIFGAEPGASSSDRPQWRLPGRVMGRGRFEARRRGLRATGTNGPEQLCEGSGNVDDVELSRYAAEAFRHMDRAPHPKIEEVAEFATGELSGAARGEVESHLAGCDLCSRRLEEYRQFLSECDRPSAKN